MVSWHPSPHRLNVSLTTGLTTTTPNGTSEDPHLDLQVQVGNETLMKVSSHQFKLPAKDQSSTAPEANGLKWSTYKHNSVAMGHQHVTRTASRWPLDVHSYHHLPSQLVRDRNPQEYFPELKQQPAPQGHTGPATGQVQACSLTSKHLHCPCHPAPVLPCAT